MVITKFVYRHSWKTNFISISLCYINSNNFLMKEIKNIHILFLFVFFSIFSKWLVLNIYYDSHLFTNVIISLQDTQYFPLIISISNLDLNPTYLESIDNSKIISFPIYGIVLHSLFYKLFGTYSFIFLELFFKLIFFFIFYLCLNKIFENKNKSLFFCILILALILLLEFIYIRCNANENCYLYIELIKDNLVENFGNRAPRPLITGIFYFSFFILLFKLKDELKENINFKYFLLIFFLLSLFLNSFFYHFVNFFIFFLVLMIFYLKKNFFKIIKKNFRKITLLFFYFFIFISPFLIQLFLGQNDYSNRIGLIEIDFEQKINLIKYYLLSLTRKGFLFLILPCILLYLILNFLISKNNLQVMKINIFFYFILISIISPIIFFLASPFVISIYHFLTILIFSCLFYIMLTLFHIFYDVINFSDKKKIGFVILLFLYIPGTFYFNKENFTKTKTVVKINELNKIQDFLNTENLKNTNLKLFTNDLDIMNLWLFNNNNQLLISDGFTNALTNAQIEFNLINNLKDFKITKENFENIISLNKTEFRNSLFLTLFTYRYQTNSLYTYSEQKDYTTEQLYIIKKTSPFRAQSQLIPEIEKLRFLNLFSNHKIDKNLLSDYVIINKSILNSKLDIKNKKYSKVFDFEKFEIYKRSK